MPLRPQESGASAEAEGFEPSVPLRAQHISSVSHSAALARFPGPPWGGHRPVTLPGAPTREQNASRGLRQCRPADASDVSLITLSNESRSTTPPSAEAIHPADQGLFAAHQDECDKLLIDISSQLG